MDVRRGVRAHAAAVTAPRRALLLPPLLALLSPVLAPATAAAQDGPPGFAVRAVTYELDGRQVAAVRFVLVPDAGEPVVAWFGEGGPDAPYACLPEGAARVCRPEPGRAAAVRDVEVLRVRVDGGTAVLSAATGAPPASGPAATRTAEGELPFTGGGAVALLVAAALAAAAGTATSHLARARPAPARGAADHQL